MFKKTIALSVALITAPCLNAGDVVAEVGIRPSVVTFVKEHKVAIAICAALGALAWYKTKTSRVVVK